MKVFLSASVPLPGRDPRFLDTVDVVAIREAIKGLVLVLLERKHSLVFGGHPAITPLVRLLFSEAGESPRDRVTLYQSSYFKREFPLDNAAFERIVVVDAVEGDRERSLIEMRRRMLREQHLGCAVFVGGMEGVLDEYALFREMHPTLPVFPIASTGAAAAMIYRDHHIQLTELETELTYPTLFRKYLPLA